MQTKFKLHVKGRINLTMNLHIFSNNIFEQTEKKIC